MTKNNQASAVLVGAAIYGIFSGILRGGSLILSFDEAHLRTGSGALPKLVQLLAVLGAAAVFVLWRGVLKKPGVCPDRVQSAGWGAGVPAALCMFGASAARLAAAFSRINLWGVLISLLLFASGFCIVGALLAARGKKERTVGVRLAALIPVFTACGVTVELYRTVTRMPETLYYSSDVAACVCCGLLLFACSGLVFRRKNTANACAFSALWAVVGLPDLIGRVMALAAGVAPGLDIFYRASDNGRTVTYGGLCTLDITLIFLFIAATAVAFSIGRGICGRMKPAPRTGA